jgi:hypothetical protein
MLRKNCRFELVNFYFLASFFDRPLKRRHRHGCPPVPLRSTYGQPWRQRQFCTNNQYGPLSGGGSTLGAHEGMSVGNAVYILLASAIDLAAYKFLDGMYPAISLPDEGLW